MTAPWVCVDCGACQADAGTCAACNEPMHDMRTAQVRDMMEHIEQRLRDRREKIARWSGVMLSVAIVVGAWFIPGYWSLRGRIYPGLPFLFDQWALMALIGFGLTVAIHRALNKPRFPYLGP